MAPELALEALDRIRPKSTVLDPMCGSGTVLAHASASGHSAFGFDLDPLAVLISSVACRPIRAETVSKSAERLLDEVDSLKRVSLPWIDRDRETLDFTRYWFATKQRVVLRKLALALQPMRGPSADVLRVALSRTIVTKDRGASLARDVSHSRPHRVRDTNDYDVVAGFMRAVEAITAIIDTPRNGKVTIATRDARHLPRSLDGAVDLVVTSPPYLNAIDYMRGHRMSLVWLGFQLSELREIRATTVGAERRAERDGRRELITGYRTLTSRQRGMLERYARDADSLCAGLARVLKVEGEAVLVVGDCNVGGTFVRNSSIVRRAGERRGLEVIDRRSRELPSDSRYLPPPTAGDSALANRLRQEVVLRFRRTT